MSDTTGALVLGGIFALAAIFALWNWSLRRRAAQRLRALGFAPCEGEERALGLAWMALAAAVGVRASVRVTSPVRRAAGWGMLHHFDLHDETPGRAASDERGHVDPSWPVYLLDLRDAAAVHSAPVVLYLAQSESRLFREMLRGLIGLSEPGAELERSPHAWAKHVVTAHGAASGKLDAVVPPGVQQKLARAAEHGFFSVHLAGGKAAFSVLPGKRDVDREWAYLSEWC
jgi:hypothetical protein